jgi:hypothetical protein
VLFALTVVETNVMGSSETRRHVVVFVHQSRGGLAQPHRCLVCLVYLRFRRVHSPGFSCWWCSSCLRACLCSVIWLAFSLACCVSIQTLFSRLLFWFLQISLACTSLDTGRSCGVPVFLVDRSNGDRTAWRSGSTTGLCRGSRSCRRTD